MDAAGRADLIETVVEEFTRRVRGGQRPSIDEYVRRYPDFSADLRRVLAAVLTMEELAPRTGDSFGVDTSLGSGGTDVGAGVLTRLGDYQILREVGRGGMGIVYEAEQVSLGRHVALKVLPAHSRLDPRRLQRFEREARAVAALHHTNIVPIFAVGEQEGLSYYAMQFIQGLGLDEVLKKLCEIRHLPGRDAAPSHPALAAEMAESLLGGGFGAPPDDVPAAADEPSTAGADPHVLSDPATSLSGSSVTLPGQSADTDLSQSSDAYWHSVARIGFQVADALRYAHAQGVCHRDIKPSNLLLDAQGIVWLADFGLAKSLEQADLTRTGEVIGTLRYMPPEQFEGQSDARGDIYGLGLTLYELLTLRPAFDETHRRQLIVKVTTGTPVPPRKIDPHIPRDLETIVLKAIAPRPADRYQTASEMAHDLERYLRDEPIHARRESVVERIGRWQRHNPAVARSVLAIVVVVLAALAGLTWLWQDAQTQAHRAQAAEQREKTERLRAEGERGRADRQAAEAENQRQRAILNFNRALEALDQLTRVGEQHLADVPGMAHVRRLLLLDSMGFYERFLNENQDNKVLQLEVARALQRVGDIHRLLGRQVEAEQAYLRALESYGTLQPAQPLALRYQAQALNNYGLLLRELGRHADARQRYLASIDLDSRYLQQSPEDWEVQSELASGLNNLANLCAETGRRPQAEEYLIQSLAIQQTALDHDPDNPHYLNHLAGTYVNLGMVVYHFERLDDAEMNFLKALERFEELVGRYPTVPDHRRDLSNALGNLGDVYRRMGRSDRAAALYRRAYDLRRELAEQFPGVPAYRNLVADSAHQLSDLQSAAGKDEDAERSYREAIDRFAELVEQFPDVAEYHSNLAKSYNNLGLLLTRNGRVADARQMCLKAVAEFETLVERFPEITLYREYAVAAYTQSGNLHHTAMELEAAEQAHRRSLEHSRKLMSDVPDVPRYRYSFAISCHNLGNALGEQGQTDEAVRLHYQALELREKLAAEFPRTPDYLFHLAKSLNVVGKFHDAPHEEYLERARRITEQLAGEFPDLPEYSDQAATSHHNLASLYARQGRWSDARPHYEAARDRWEKLVVDFAGNRDYHVHLARLLSEYAGHQHRRRVLSGAEASFRRGLAVWRAAADASPQYLVEMVGMTNNFALLLQDQNQLAPAEEQFRAAIALLEPLPPAAGQRGREFLARAKTNLGKLLVRTGRIDDAESCYLDARRVRRQLAEDFPEKTVYDRQIASTHELLAAAYRHGRRFDQAEDSVGSAIETYQRLLKENPQSPSDRRKLAACQEQRGRILIQQTDRADDALEAFETALDEWATLADQQPTVAQRLELASRYGACGFYLAEAGSTNVAESYYGQALELLARLATESPRSEPVRREMVRATYNLAQLCDTQARYAEAEQRWHESLELLEQLAAEFPSPRYAGNINHTRERLATHYADCADPSRRDPRQAVELAKKLVQTAPEYPAYWNTLGVAEYRHGNGTASLEAFDKAASLNEASVGLREFFSAMARWQLGQPQAAREALGKAVSRMDEHAPRDPRLLRLRAEAERLVQGER